MKNIITRFDKKMLCLLRGFQLAFAFYADRPLTYNEALARLMFVGLGLVPLSIDEDKVNYRACPTDKFLASLDADPMTEMFKAKFVQLLGSNPSLLN